MMNDAISKDMEAHVSLELNDIKSILDAEGLTSTFSNIGRGKNAHNKSILPLIEQYNDCENIRAMLICFTINKTFSLVKIKEAIDEINGFFNQDQEIIFSILIDNKLTFDEVQVKAIIKQQL